MIGPFFLPIPSSTSDEYSIRSSWAFGNVHTCDFQGFILTFGATTTCMYMLFLCLYYYCKLKRNMSDTTFTRKIEKKLHCFIILFNAAVCLSALATKTFNPLPIIGSCHLARKPFLCDPRVPGSCERGQYANFYTILYFPLAVPITCLIGTLILMIAIVAHVVQRYHTFRQPDRNSRDLGGGGGGGEETEVNNDLSRLLQRELTLQVIFYALAFALSYGWAVILSILEKVGIRPPLFMSIILAASFPLMGFFNVLIYTHPQIVAYRRLHSDVSWLVAFFRVVKAGGENPDSARSSPSSSNTSCQMFCCRDHQCCLFSRNCEMDNISKALLSILRVRASCNNGIPTNSLRTHQNHGKKELDSTTTAGNNDAIEQRVSTIGRIRTNDGDAIYRHSNSRNFLTTTFLSSQSDVISKAFEKASQRARAMNEVDVIKIEDDDGSIDTFCQRSGWYRMNSQWSNGASPGSSCSGGGSSTSNLVDMINDHEQPFMVHVSAEDDEENAPRDVDADVMLSFKQDGFVAQKKQPP